MIHLGKYVLDVEKKGLDGHAISSYPKASMKDAITCASVLWKIRQLEILEGCNLEKSELAKININELVEIKHIDACLYLEDHDAWKGLRERGQLG